MEEAFGRILLQGMCSFSEALLGSLRLSNVYRTGKFWDCNPAILYLKETRDSARNVFFQRFPCSPLHDSLQG